MANNPRKFSEKIALLNQKQQECNVEFEKILQEVSGAIKVSASLFDHNADFLFFIFYSEICSEIVYLIAMSFCIRTQHLAGTYSVGRTRQANESAHLLIYTT